MLFYLAVARLPLATVGAIEFLGVVLLASAGARTPRNAAALALTIGGVAALADLRLAGQPLGFAFAFGNCALFMLYVVLGHRVANTDAGTGAMSGIDQLGAAMLVATVVVTPVGLGGALAVFPHPALLAAGVGVGVCSSVIPYVTDQQAMARLPRASSPPVRIYWASRWSSPASRGIRSRRVEKVRMRSTLEEAGCSMRGWVRRV